MIENNKIPLEKNDIDSFIVDDLKLEDLDSIGWSGNPAHPRHVKEALLRVQEGEVEYLAVRNTDGSPISIGGIDYKAHENAGTLWQLSTMESLRGLGLGTKLITALEDRIKQRGIHKAMLGVENTNDKARALYKRLGYTECGQDTDSWEIEDKDGNKHTHYADIILMKKDLN